VPFKGTDIVLEAFARAGRLIPGLRLVAFGNEPVKPELPLPAGGEYHQSPPQDRLRTMYARCDAWLCGSRAEGFGLPILEAMACRTPVIATPAGAATELLAGGGGVLVRPEDPADMARGIVHLCGLSDPEWRKLSDAAYATATGYSWDDATGLFEDALLTALARTTAPGSRR
jgi:glycosyltransferase involved in cell wall biosynthesis